MRASFLVWSVVVILVVGGGAAWAGPTSVTVTVDPQVAHPGDVLTFTITCGWWSAQGCGGRTWSFQAWECSALSGNHTTYVEGSASCALSPLSGSCWADDSGAYAAGTYPLYSSAVASMTWQRRVNDVLPDSLSELIFCGQITWEEVGYKTCVVLTVPGSVIVPIERGGGPCTSSLASGSVTPGSGDPSTSFTYRVNYSDTCNRAPDLATDGKPLVYVAVWSASTGPRWYRMAPLDPSDTNYLDGAWFTFSKSGLDAGTYAFRFRACTGGVWADWPLPAGSYQPGPTVSATPPVLSSGYVVPSSGTSATLFTWRVKYWNTGNAPPDDVKVAIWFPTLKKTYWYAMWAYEPADTNYRDGAWYTFSRRWLPPGAYAYRFAARQGTNWAYWPTPVGSYASGPLVGP